MKLILLHLFGVMILVTSCSGQKSTPVPVSTISNMLAPIAIGDTVKELCKNIMIIYQDMHDVYWFGSWEDGLYRFDPSTPLRTSGRTLIRYTTNDGLSHNRIDQILEDKSGKLYFNTSGGINKFDGHRFTTLRIANTSTDDWKLGPDDLWFKCNQDSGQVYRYDGAFLHRLIFPETELEKEFFEAHLQAKYPNMRRSLSDVYTLYRDRKGNVWFGTAALGVSRFDGKSIDWISGEDVNELHDGPANGVRSIIEDKEGKFWFSNTLYRYTIYQNSDSKMSNMDKGEFTYTRERGIGSLDGRPNGNLDEYMSAVVDDHGDVWMVTYAAGVWRYKGKKIIHYPVKDGTKEITLFSIYKDHNGSLWLGTHENGVYKFNGKTFERFVP